MESNLDKFVELSVSKLSKAPWNYKKEDEFLQHQLQENLKKNGQLENVIVREMPDKTYEVVNGNHRYEAIKTMGWKKIIAYNLGKISESEAQRIAVVTNETKFQTDQVKLAGLMKQLQEEYSASELAKDMPWTEEQISNFAKLTDFNWENPTMPPSGAGANDDPEGWVSVKLRLPEGIAEQLHSQIDRFKRALHPDESDLSLVSPVQSLEAMLQHLAQLADNELI